MSACKNGESFKGECGGDEWGEERREGRTLAAVMDGDAGGDGVFLIFN